MDRKGTVHKGSTKKRLFFLGIFPFKTLPKALRPQALTALTSNFGLVGLVMLVWLGRFG